MIRGVWKQDPVIVCNEWKHYYVRSHVWFVCFRFERQQTTLKEEVTKLGQRESEAAREEKIKAMSRERQHRRQEAEKAKQLVHTLTHTHCLCSCLVPF